VRVWSALLCSCPRVLASKAIALTAEMFPEGASQLGAYTRVSVDMDSHSETPLATPELFVGFRVFGPVAATAAAPTLPQVGSAASSLSHSTAASGSVVSRVDSDSSMDVSVLNTPSWKAVQRSSPAVKRDLRAVFASFSTSNTAFLSFTELAAGIHLRFVRACLQRVGMRKRYSDVGLVALSQYCARQVCSVSVLCVTVWCPFAVRRFACVFVEACRNESGLRWRCSPRIVRAVLQVGIDPTRGGHVFPAVSALGVGRT